MIWLFYWKKKKKSQTLPYRNTLEECPPGGLPTSKQGKLDASVRKVEQNQPSDHISFTLNFGRSPVVHFRLSYIPDYEPLLFPRESMVWTLTWLIYGISGLTVLRGGGVWEEPQKQDRWKSWREEEEANLKRNFYRSFFAQTPIMDSTCDAALKLESINLANQEGNKPEELTRLKREARLSELIKADSLKLKSLVRTGWRLGAAPKNKASMTFPFCLIGCFTSTIWRQWVEAFSIKVSKIFLSTSHFSKGTSVAVAYTCTNMFLLKCNGGGSWSGGFRNYGSLQKRNPSEPADQFHVCRESLTMATTGPEPMYSTSTGKKGLSFRSA